MSLRNTIGSADFETTDFAFPQDAVAGLCADAEYFAHLLNLHRRKQPHHTAVIALRGSLTPLREVLASEAVLLRRSGKIRSTELFSFQGTSEAV